MAKLSTIPNGAALINFAAGRTVESLFAALFGGPMASGQASAAISDFPPLAGDGVVAGSYIHKDTGAITANPAYQYQIWTGLTEGEPLLLTGRIAGIYTALAVWLDADGERLAASFIAPDNGDPEDHEDRLVFVPPGAVALGMAQPTSAAAVLACSVKRGVRRQGILPDLDLSKTASMLAIGNVLASIQRVGQKIALTATGATNDASNTRLWSVPATKDTFVQRFRFVARAAGTLEIKVASRAGNVNTIVSSKTIAIPAAGTYDFTPKDFGYIPVAAGQLQGYYSDVGVYLPTSASIEYDKFYSGTGNFAPDEAFTQATLSTVRVQAWIELADPLRDATAINQAIADVATLKVDGTSAKLALAAMVEGGLLQEVADHRGYATQPVPDGTGNLSVTNGFVYALPFSAPTVLEEMYGYYSAAGTHTGLTFTSDGADPPHFTPTGRSVTVTVPGAGFHAAPVFLPVYAGEYYMEFSNVGRFTGSTAGNSGGYFSGSPLGFTAGSSAPVTNVRLQLGARFKSYAPGGSIGGGSGGLGTSDLCMWGDSMTDAENGYSDELAALYPERTAYNQGIKGQTPAEIAARMGAVPVTLATAVDIPTSGSVTFAPSALSISLLRRTSGSAAMKVLLAGVECSLSYSQSTDLYTLTPVDYPPTAVTAAIGERLEVLTGITYTTDASAAVMLKTLLSGVVIIRAGYNGISTALLPDLYRVIDAMVAQARRFTDKIVVIGQMLNFANLPVSQGGSRSTDESSYAVLNKLVQFNEYQRRTFGDWFFDAHANHVANGGAETVTIHPNGVAKSFAVLTATAATPKLLADGVHEDGAAQASTAAGTNAHMDGRGI